MVSVEADEQLDMLPHQITKDEAWVSCDACSA